MSLWNIDINLFENKIIGLQNESTKGGILKSTSDYEEFWKLIQEEDGGTEVKQNLQNIKFKSLYFSCFFFFFWILINTYTFCN